MKKREIGAYHSYVLCPEDVVVVMGATDGHEERLRTHGFGQDEDTGEWVGTGACLYSLSPGAFYDMFSGGQGSPSELQAQATDGENAFQIDGLPVVATGPGGKDVIEEITAVDLATRSMIDEGVGNFKVG